MLKLGVMSIGFPNFRVDIAQENYERSMALFDGLDLELVVEKTVLVNEEEIGLAASRMKEKAVDALLLKIGTYSYGSALQTILDCLKGVHLILWGEREPITDPNGAIPLNTLCAMNMYGSFLKRIGYTDYSYCYGCFEEEATQNKLRAIIKALELGKKMHTSRIGVVGGRVPGFYLSNVDELRFRSAIGPEIINYSLASLIADADKISELEAEKDAEQFNASCRVTAEKDTVLRSSRIYLALKKFAAQNKIDAFALRCWPELQELYNVAACGIIARLNQEGICVSCEGDITGLATMMLLSQLSNDPVMLVDLVNISQQGIVKVWHCGCGAPALAADTPVFESHPTMKQCPGLATSFDLKTGSVVLCKLSEGDPYRMLIAPGQCVEPDRKIRGNQGDLKFDFSSDDLLDTIMQEGIEHHYCVGYDVDTHCLEQYCRIFGIRKITIERRKNND